MSHFESYCSYCGGQRLKELYSRDGYMVVKCTTCGKKSEARNRAKSVSGSTIVTYCSYCGNDRKHVNYTDQYGDSRYLCCTCGKDK